MSFKIINIKIIKELILSERIIKEAKNKATDFIRLRKMGIQVLIMYILNKRGLSSKMEIEDFNEIIDVKNISAPAVLKQRQKLNPIVFQTMLDESNKCFYQEFKDEVVTFKGYVLASIDGSDFEIPNSKTTRKIYNGKLQEHCARITVSTMFDLLNHNTIDTYIAPYNFSELTMAKSHLLKAKEIITNYKIIRIMDRGYVSLEDIFNSIKNDDKFIVRSANKNFKDEILQMNSNDEIIEIKYEYNRVHYYKDKCPKLYKYLKSGGTVKIRCVKIMLESGEEEILFTNLNDEIGSNDLAELYHLRWGIETNYHYLKESLKIETITSGKENIIKQDILSQILVFNILQPFINDAQKEIKQEEYLNQMKINVNMATGFMKKALILILLEEDVNKQAKLLDRLFDKITKYIVPIKPNRKSKRKNNPKNKHHINKRKTF